MPGAIGLQFIDKPVVEPVWPALPKLDTVWREEVAAPVRRAWNLAVCIFFFQAGHGGFERGPVFDRGALV